MPGYTKTTFTSGSTALTASFLNTLQDWIVGMQDANINAVGSGELDVKKIGLTTNSLKRLGKYTGSANQTITHSWGEQADIVLVYYNGNFGTPPSQVPAVYNEGVNSFSVHAQSGYSWTALVIKF